MKEESLVFLKGDVDKFDVKVSIEQTDQALLPHGVDRRTRVRPVQKALQLIK